MNRKTVARLASWITLAIMAASVALYFFGPAPLAAPAIAVLMFSGWLQGICWGYLYAIKGRLTWF